MYVKKTDKILASNIHNSIVINSRETLKYRKTKEWIQEPHKMPKVL